MIVGGGIFIAGLLYLTLRSTSTPLGQSPDRRARAQEMCQESVREEAPDARFPFAATAEDLGGDLLRLSGSVDLGPESDPTRSNYECLLRRVQGGGMVVDSVLVWQSH